MNRQEILEGLNEILQLIKPSLNLSSVNEDTQLISDIGLDSLTIMLLSLAIENKFKINRFLSASHAMHPHRQEKCRSFVDSRVDKNDTTRQGERSHFP